MAMGAVRYAFAETNGRADDEQLVRRLAGELEAHPELVRILGPLNPMPESDW
jgi:hypothetical protein